MHINTRIARRVHDRAGREDVGAAQHGEWQAPSGARPFGGGQGESRSGEEVGQVDQFEHNGVGHEHEIELADGPA